ncbi:MAG: NAD-dependent epimerase/dehydratase family protein [Deltaproteobacteria bacterium]|nr:NAD-dependent epimerase/dehydratase family protein [Deltaproteobacteria bacterium]
MTVVTGSSGHVGGNLIRSLLARGREVRAVIRTDTRAIDGLDVEVVRADVLDPESLVRAFEGADTVFHLAALISIIGDQGGKVHRTNVDGPRNVVEACLKCGVKRLVHFSSIHAYEQAPQDATLDECRDFVPGRAPAYDRSKAAGQRAVLSAVERGLSAVIVNPTAVIGPHDYKPSRMGAVICALARGRFPGLVEGGFDWVDVRDVVAGALAAEQKGRPGQNYLLSGRFRTVAGLAKVVADVTGTPAPRFVSPLWLAAIGAPFVEGWCRMTGGFPLYTRESLHALKGNRDVSHAKAAEELGYSARPLEETIRDTVTWFRERGVLPPASAGGASASST